MSDNDTERKLRRVLTRNFSRIGDLSEGPQRKVQESSKGMLDSLFFHFDINSVDPLEWSLMLNVSMRVMAMLLVLAPTNDWDVDSVVDGLREHYKFFREVPPSEAPITPTE